MDTLQQRLASVFPQPLERGVMATVAQICGVSRPTVSNWFNNPEKVATISRTNAETICRHYGLAVSPLWLSEGTGPREAAPPAAPQPEPAPAPEVSSSMKDEFVTVRRADVKFSNGHGQVTYEEDDHPPLVFRSDFLRRMGISAGDAVVVEAEGISNEPKIPEGAVVLVNRGDRERLNGELFAFRCDGELLIKRLERVDGVGILATADNPNFKPKTRIYTMAADFEVIGRAVWTGAVL